MGSRANSGRALVFSHIPKTAGTSLNLFLRANFGSQLLAARARSGTGAHKGAYTSTDYEKDKWVYRRARCISGHDVKPWVDFGENENHFAWFTFLRNPQKRFVSLYVHQQTNGIAEHKMDLLDWSARFDRSDGMVKMIAGEKSLDKAIEILETKVEFVGLTERYDESLKMLVAHFGLKNMTVDNSTVMMKSRASGIAESIFGDLEKYGECLEQNNLLDQRLYQYVVDRIWSRQEQTLVAGQAYVDSMIEKTIANPNRHPGYLGFQLKEKLVYRSLLRLGIL